MAELNNHPGAPSFRAAEAGSGGHHIPASTQLLAIAWMRWRMFANGFRRTSKTRRQFVGLFAAILLRIIIWPIFAMMAIGPSIGCGYFAWRAIAHHHPSQLVPLLAAVFLGWQFVAVNGVSIAAQMSTFDPASLLRFPLRFGRYLVLRLLLGLLTPSTVIGFLALFAAAVGITIADTSIAPAAFLVLAIYALMNLFFSRMVGVWLERWLASRRAREIFGVLMALVVVSIQYVNFSGRHLGEHHRQAASPSSSWLVNFVTGSHSFLNWLPPGYAAQSITPGGHPLTRLIEFALLVLWTAAFLAAMAYRLHKQFLGEYLAEGAPRTTASPRRAAGPRALENGHRTSDNSQPLTSAPVLASVTASNQQLTTSNQQLFSPTIAACLRKEWIYLSGNTAQLISMLMPLVFVFIIGRGFTHQSNYLLAGAIGYSMLGLLTSLYNIFGFDAAGVQLYLLAPVRMRDIILAKNLMSLALLSLVATLAWCLAAYLAVAHIPLAVQISTFFWVIFMLFANLSLGTLRSIQAPMKVSMAQARRLRASTGSKTSGLLVLAVLFGSFLLYIPVALLCFAYNNQWLALLIFVPLAAAAVGAYIVLLLNIDKLMLTHRDTFAQNLCGE